MFGQTRGFNKCNTNVLAHQGQNFTTAAIAIRGYVQILCGHTTRFSASILNIEGTFAHSATIVGLIHCFFHGFLRGFRAIHEESLTILAMRCHVCLHFASPLLDSYLTPRIGWNSKLKSSHAGSLFLVPFSPPSLALSRFPWAYNNK